MAAWRRFTVLVIGLPPTSVRPIFNSKFSCSLILAGLCSPDTAFISKSPSMAWVADNALGSHMWPVSETPDLVRPAGYR